MDSSEIGKIACQNINQLDSPRNLYFEIFYGLLRFIKKLVLMIKSLRWEGNEFDKKGIDLRIMRRVWRDKLKGDKEEFREIKFLLND